MIMVTNLIRGCVQTIRPLFFLLLAEHSASLQEICLSTPVDDKKISLHPASFLPESDLGNRTSDPVVIGLSQRDGLTGVIDARHLSLINSQRQATVYRHNTPQPV